MSTAGPQRVMDEVGLTHMSLSVSDLAGVLAQVESFGGVRRQGGDDASSSR